MTHRKTASSFHYENCLGLNNYVCSNLSFSDPRKFAEITAVVQGLLSPREMQPLFAPLNRSIHNLSISFWKEGSSIPMGREELLHMFKRKGLLLEALDVKNRVLDPTVARPHNKAVVLPVPDGPNAIGMGQL